MYTSQVYNCLSSKFMRITLSDSAAGRQQYM